MGIIASYLNKTPSIKSDESKANSTPGGLISAGSEKLRAGQSDHVGAFPAHNLATSKANEIKKRGSQ